MNINHGQKNMLAFCFPKNWSSFVVTLVIGYAEYYDHSNDIDSRNSPNLWRGTIKEGHYKFSTLFVRWYIDHSLFPMCAHHVEIASCWVPSETNQVVCSNSFSTRYILAMALKFFIGFLCIN